MAQDEGLLVQSQHRFYINTTPDEASETWERLAKGYNSFDVETNEELDQTQYLDGDGFGSSDVTGAQLTVSFSGHRYYGDAAQDFVFSLKMEVGEKRKTSFRWELPTGEVFEGPCTVAEISGPSGEANQKGEIETAIHFNGKPTYLPEGTGGTE